MNMVFGRTQTGYREGITAGKLSTLQTGFDTGFNEVGALLGRHVGLLRGQIAALLLLTSPTPVTTTPATRKLVGRNRASPSSASAAAGAASAGPSSSLPLLASARLEEAKVELRSLAKELDALTLAKLAEPDYEAMEHEREHQDDAGVAVTRETDQQRAAREQILPDLRQRLEGIRSMLGLGPLQA